ADAGMRGMSIAEVARVERTIRGLDPVEIRWLEHLSKVTAVESNSTLAEAQNQDVRTRDAAFRTGMGPDRAELTRMLESFGLLRLEFSIMPDSWPDQLFMCPLGVSVLRVMDLYLRGVPNPDEP